MSFFSGPKTEPKSSSHTVNVHFHVGGPAALGIGAGTGMLETKQVAPDFSLDTNADADEVYDGNYSGELGDPNYKYYSDPETGLSALVDASKFYVEVVDIRSLMDLPPPDKLKVLTFRLVPKDGSEPFFQILTHQKSGTAKSDQRARDNESKLLAKVGQTLNQRYPNTILFRYQGDSNIPVFVPKEDVVNIRYLSNPGNYKVNETGLENLLNLLTPLGAVITRVVTPDINVKGRADNLLDNNQSTKLGNLEGSSKAITVEGRFIGVELAPEAIAAQNRDTIAKLKVPTTPIHQFGIGALDSDHRPTRPLEDKQSNNFITFALISPFGSQGFINESALILAQKRNPKDRARRAVLKDEWTAEVFRIVMEALEKKGIDRSELYGDTTEPTLADAAKFIQKHEWVLMNETSLKQIFNSIANLPQTRELNTHCIPEKAILNTPDKITDVLKRVFSKNYSISVLEGNYNTQQGVKQPDKDELINVIKINNRKVAYALKNYTVDDNHPSQVYSGDVPLDFELPDSGRLTQEQEESLKRAIIQDVNRKNPVAAGQRPAAVKGTQLLNNLGDNTGWQCCAGFPNAIENWDPVQEQHNTIVKLVDDTGAAFIAFTECSSQKHLDYNKTAQKKNAKLRDEQNYVDRFHQRMTALCERSNIACTRHRRNAIAGRSSAVGLPVAAPVVSSQTAPKNPSPFSFKKTNATTETPPSTTYMEDESGSLSYEASQRPAVTYMQHGQKRTTSQLKQQPQTEARPSSYAPTRRGGTNNG